jgi:hypothetical protein
MQLIKITKFTHLSPLLKQTNVRSQVPGPKTILKITLEENSYD